MPQFSKATLDDIPALNKLINSAYRGETAKQGWTHESDLLTGIRINEEGLTELINNPGAVIIKYTDDAKLLACVLLERQDDSLYLGMLTVDPSLQEKGIGKLLLQEAEQEARKQGIQKIKMTVISVREELISFYKRRGYVDTGIKKPFPTEEAFGTPLQQLEFIVMEKIIKD